MNSKINPREFIRRALKMFFIFLILYLTLINNGKLDNQEIVQIMSINIIIFCIIDTLYPSFSPK